MNKGKKIAIALVVDMLMLVAIVYAVATIIHNGDEAWKRNIAKVIIVLFIPCMFYMTYMSFSDGKYDELPADLLEDEESSDEVENQVVEDKVED